MDNFCSISSQNSNAALFPLKNPQIIQMEFHSLFDKNCS